MPEESGQFRHCVKMAGTAFLPKMISTCKPPIQQTSACGIGSALKSRLATELGED
jgi:hypothetical protein